MRRRLLDGGPALLCAAAAACGETAAIVNKTLVAHGHRGFATPAGMADALFDGSVLVKTALWAIAAFVVLAALAALLAGAWQTIRGDRGGVELTLSGVFGVLGLMAAMTVVM